MLGSIEDKLARLVNCVCACVYVSLCVCAIVYVSLGLCVCVFMFRCMCLYV